MSHTRAFILAALSFVLSLTPPALTPPALAQTVQGTVKDPLGAVVPNASVQLLDPASAVVQSVSTDDAGRYTLLIAHPQRYRLRAQAATFGPTLTDPLFLTPTHTERQDITLASPTFSDQVTVTASGTPTPLAQSGAPITLLTQSDYPYTPDLQQPLRLVPGVQITQSGQTGSVASLFMRGADSGSTRVLLDGTPLNDIGGAVNFANLATVGIARIEVLREPNSALYGSDALAGVVSLTSTRGSTPLPQFLYAVDGGNFGLFRQEAALAGAQRNFDYYNAFARLNTSNSIAADAYHDATFAGNYGFALDPQTALRLTLRHLATNGGQPNAIVLYGIPDSASASEHDLELSASVNHQTTLRWHNQLQYGRERLRTQSSDFAPTGIPVFYKGSPSYYLGNPVTLTGANGYTVSGQAIFQYAGAYPTFFNTSSNRDFVYAQSDLKFTPHLTALAAFRYEDERGSTIYAAGAPGAPSQVDHGNYSYTLQLAGDLRSRFFYTLGSGIEDNAVYGKALTPRASLAYYVARPSSRSFFSGTKLHGSFGKGVLGPNVGQENSSLYDVLAAKNSPLLAQDHIGRLGAEYSRTYDAGLEQQFGNDRARLNLTFFHNQFTNSFQYVSVNALITLGVDPAAAMATGFGAYVNSQALRAMGAESEFEYRLADHLFARAGYTYLDAVVQHSLGSGSFNKASNFASTPIGAYAPLDGARPFRRAPHTGYFALAYTHARFDAQLAGSLVGSRDDSTFLSDKNFGSSLLLPNRNLDGAYQRLELTSSYRINAHLTTYANLQNLLNEHYFEAFGYPALPLNLRGGLKYTFGGESWSLH